VLDFPLSLSGKAEGRRQKAEGNSGSCPLPVTGGSKGLRPPLNKSSVAPSQEGFESPSDLILLPSALSIAAFFNSELIGSV